MNKMAGATIHISKGNTKTGAIPSFSLPAGATCSAKACKTCYADGCYARKLERLRPTVHKTYEENYLIAKNYPNLLESYLNLYFSMPNSPRMFRIHVAGDFFSREYFELWLRVIRSHPNTTFLAFTKREGVIAPYLSSLPKNLELIWSAWPGVPIPKTVYGLSIAWMQDGTEDRIPDNAVQCPGNCETCAKCWAMDGHDVVFRKH